MAKHEVIRRLDKQVAKMRRAMANRPRSIVDKYEAPVSIRRLQELNRQRTLLYPNPKGETKHSGQDWSLNDWMVATMGELGEAANLLKKVRRHDFTISSVRKKLAHELADVVIYIVLLADKCGIDLEDAVREKFNARSRKLKLDFFL